MSVPTTTIEYRLPKAGVNASHAIDPVLTSTLQFDGIHNLVQQEAQIPRLKASEVLVKIHAVSLQVGHNY